MNFRIVLPIWILFMKRNFDIVERKCQSMTCIWSFGNETIQDLMLDEIGINCGTFAAFFGKNLAT